VRILLLGAGGAARGALGPLLEQAPSRLHIVNRDANKAEALAKEFEKLGSISGGGYDSVDAAPYDLIINATAASLQGTVPPLATAAVSAESLCYDMAYGKEDTAFVRWAKDQGARAELGWGMLVEQAAESFHLWRGVRPDTAPVLAAVRSPVPVLNRTQ
jgi:shikimate dehydrogenase